MESIASKKKAIFDSTLELIKEHGFHGAPMSLVAKNAGVAAGTIYHYFESKDQLIYELYDYNKSRVVEIVHAALEENGSYKEKFFKIWMHVYRFYIQNTNVLIFFEQYVNSPYNETKQPDDLQDRPLYNFLVEGINNGFLKGVKPEILLVLIISSILSTAKLNQFGNISLDPTDLNQIVDLLWDGIAISPASGSDTFPKRANNLL